MNLSIYNPYSEAQKAIVNRRSVKRVTIAKLLETVRNEEVEENKKGPKPKKTEFTLEEDMILIKLVMKKGSPATVYNRLRRINYKMQKVFGINTETI